MKLAAFGDLHLDEASPRYEHALEVLNWAVQDAIEQGAEHFCFLGDIFEGAPTSREYAAFIGVLFKLAQRGQVMICRGNHEDYEAMSFFGLLHPNIKVAWDQPVRMQFGHALAVLVIPYPTRHRAPYDNLESDGSIGGSMRAAAARIGQWVKRNASERQPLVVLGHFTIEGMTTRDTEFELHQTNEVVVPVTAFAPAALTVVGHIHRAQEITPTVIGAGNLYRCSFAEAQDDKSYVLVDVAHGVTWERRRIPAREMVEIKVELDAITPEWLFLTSLEVQGKEAKITVTMDEEQAPRYSKDVFEPIRAGAAYLLLERVVRPVQRVRAPQVSAAMNIEAQLTAWLAATQQHVGAERIGELVRMYEEIS